MANPSSISSSELSPFERVKPGRVPVAAIAFLAIVVAVELAAGASRIWFADLAAWQWETKQTLIDDGALGGSAGVFGTSVLFHGLDPTPANATSATDGRVVNLALNGMLLSHQTQLLRRRLHAGRLDTVVVELRDVTTERASWLRGPYFHFWASFPEFAESSFYYWQPAAALSFAASRVFATMRFRDALDNWIFESAAARAPYEETRRRNEALPGEMRQFLGMVRADFDDRVRRPLPGDPQERRLAIDRAGEIWLHRFLDVASESGAAAVLLIPPAPPDLIEKPGPDGFRSQLDALLSRVRARHPAVTIDVFEPTGFAADHFADDHHLNARGRAVLSARFAEWFAAYRGRQPQRSR